MGSQTLGRDNSLSLPSLLRRRVSGVPPWLNGYSVGHMIWRLGVRILRDHLGFFSSVFNRPSLVLLPRSINKY